VKPQGGTHTKCQTTNKPNKQNRKKTAGQRLGRRGTEEAGHKRGKRAEEKGVKHRTKAREHQVNCLAQRVEDKGRRGGGEAAKATPPPTYAVLIETGARVYWERKGLGLG
jgi:hypothetical protein